MHRPWLIEALLPRELRVTPLGLSCLVLEGSKLWSLFWAPSPSQPLNKPQAIGMPLRKCDTEDIRTEYSSHNHTVFKLLTQDHCSQGTRALSGVFMVRGPSTSASLSSLSTHFFQPGLLKRRHYQGSGGGGPLSLCSPPSLPFILPASCVC